MNWDDEEAFHILVKWGVLSPSRKRLCRSCGNIMHYINNTRKYRCSKTLTSPQKEKKRCFGQLSINYGTIFEKRKIKYAQLMMFTQLWSTKTPLKLIQKETELSHTDSVFWNARLRASAAKLYEKQPKIGGLGKIVEIGECKFTNRKSNKLVEPPWMFGGIEIGSSRFFAFPVENRNSSTLQTLIKKYITIGTTIISGYENLEILGYKHINRNNSTNETDQAIRPCRINEFWKVLKSNIPKFVFLRHLLLGYIARYWFLQTANNLNVNLPEYTMRLMAGQSVFDNHEFRQPAPENYWEDQHIHKSIGPEFEYDDETFDNEYNEEDVDSEDIELEDLKPISSSEHSCDEEILKKLANDQDESDIEYENIEYLDDCFQDELVQ